MKLRGLSIALVVLAALLGVLYWSNHRKAKEEANPAPAADIAPKILSLNQADITGLRLERKDQPPVDLSKNASGTWQITAPKPMAADQESISSILYTLSSLSSERVVDDKPSDVSQYGLKPPAIEVDVSLKDNKTDKLLIGEQTPAGNSYYAMRVGDPRLFTMAGYNKTSLDKSASDLRDRRLLTADFDKVSQIELLNQKPDKKQDITFAREKDAWQVLKPKPCRADEIQVDDLIRALKDARFETTTDEESAKLAASFKSAAPVAIARVSGVSGTQDLEVRKSKHEYLAKSSVVSGIYKVSGSLGTSLDKTLDDFRNKKLFSFGYQDPNKVEIHDGPKSYFLTRSGSDWWGPDGKKLDESGAENLIGDLRDLSADKFPDSGFTTPAIEITVTSQDDKRVEKVALAKVGDTYIAKRENEPELYQLATGPVDALQKAAADLKPAPEPKTKK